MRKLIRFGLDQNLVALIYLLLSILIASIAVGINIIAFPAVLISHDVAALQIGFSSTNEIIFGVAMSFFLSQIVSRLTAMRTAFIIAIFYALIVATIFFYQNFYLWLLLSGLGGACWFSLFVIRQAWINHLIIDRNRSVILALTTTIFCFGFVIGSFLVKHFGALNHLSFLISAGLILISVLMLFLIRKTQPTKIDSQKISFREFIAKEPKTSVARFLLDLQAGCLVCLGVVFGVKIGLSVENAGFLIGAFMASGLFDLYAGFLVRDLNRSKLIMTGFLGCLSTMIFGLIFYKSYIALLACFFFFGASCALIMVATLTIINESFAKEKLVAANATFQAIGSCGSVLGCFAGGIFIDLFDFYGFFAIIIMANLLYFIYILFGPEARNKRHKHSYGKNKIVN